MEGGRELASKQTSIKVIENPTGYRIIIAKIIAVLRAEK